MFENFKIRFGPRRSASSVMKSIAAISALAVAQLAGLGQSAGAQSPAAQEARGQAQPAQQAQPTQQAQLKAQMAQQVKHELQSIVPKGLRLTSVRLDCAPPPGATVKQVAPGVETLSSPGFTVELDAPGGTIYCSATAGLQEQVLVAARSLGAGQTVTRADFRVGWNDAFAGSPDMLSTLDGRAVTLVALRAGGAVHSSDLQKAIVIHSGEIVAVTVKNGAVTLLTHLKAINDAGDGEAITLENPTSGRLVAARAAGPGRAEIDLR
jgi:flagella basal body P-ring formation protein FlgA